VVSQQQYITFASREVHHIGKLTYTPEGAAQNNAYLYFVLTLRPFQVLSTLYCVLSVYTPLQPFARRCQSQTQLTSESRSHVLLCTFNLEILQICFVLALRPFQVHSTFCYAMSVYTPLLPFARRCQSQTQITSENPCTTLHVHTRNCFFICFTDTHPQNAYCDINIECHGHCYMQVTAESAVVWCHFRFPLFTVFRLLYSYCNFILLPVMSTRQTFLVS